MTRAEMAVAWGLEHRDLDNVTAIGIDEIAWRKRKEKFLTLVYQIDSGCKRLLWVGQSRTKKGSSGFPVGNGVKIKAAKPEPDHYFEPLSVPKSPSGVLDCLYL